MAGGEEQGRRSQAAPMKGCPKCGRSHVVRPGRGRYEVQVMGRCSACRMPFYETQVSGEREIK